MSYETPKTHKTITPAGEDSTLWLALGHNGLTLCIDKDGLTIEVEVPISDFRELARRWTANEWDTALTLP